MLVLVTPLPRSASHISTGRKHLTPGAFPERPLSSHESGMESSYSSRSSRGPVPGFSQPAILVLQLFEERFAVFQVRSTQFGACLPLKAHGIKRLFH